MCTYLTIKPLIYEIAVGYRSLTTTIHCANVNVPSSGQHVTARLSASTVSVAAGNRAQGPLVRDTIIRIKIQGAYYINLQK
jgi:hypothetical protein